MAVMLDEAVPAVRDGEPMSSHSDLNSRRRRTPETGGAHGLSLLILEEHDVARCGLRLILASQPWVGPCSSAPDLSTAVDCIQRAAPGVILYAAKPGLQDAQETCRALRQAAPESVLLLMSTADRVTAQTLSSVAAYAHISKNSSAREIVKIVRLASLGLRVTSDAPATLLSTRQHEVLELLAAGETNGEIACRLYLSAHTVKQHTCAIYRKLQVRNRAEAIRRAQRLGLLA